MGQKRNANEKKMQAKINDKENLSRETHYRFINIVNGFIHFSKPQKYSSGVLIACNFKLQLVEQKAKKP